MSLKTFLEAGFTRVGTEFKTIRTLISGTATGDVSGLATTATNLVAGVNEVKVTADAAAAANHVNTTTLTEGTNLYFTDARVIAAPVTGFVSGAGAITAADSVLQAVQKLDGNIAAIDLTNLIDDVTASATTTYSSNKIGTEITAAVAAVVDASPAALDTLNEIAAALGDDANYAATVTNALALKANIADTKSTTELGAAVDTTDYEAVFVAALA